MKAVESESDGSTVYHITCLSEPTDSSAVTIAQLQSIDTGQQALPSQAEIPHSQPQPVTDPHTSDIQQVIADGLCDI